MRTKASSPDFRRPALLRVEAHPMNPRALVFMGTACGQETNDVAGIHDDSAPR